MSAKMEVKSSEHGLVRVFALDLPKPEAQAFVAAPASADAPWPLRDALGAGQLEPDWVDLVHPDELGELGLAGYLTQGLGVAEAELDGARDRLAALDGPVVLLPSQAFGGTAQTLAPRAPLRWIGSFREQGAPPVTDRLRAESAMGQFGVSADSAHTPAPAGRTGWMVTMIVALALVICLALLFIGLGGLG